MKKEVLDAETDENKNFEVFAPAQLIKTLMV